MDRQMLELLQRQEQTERSAYQSTAAIRAMIQADFSNAEELLEVLDGRRESLPELFRLSTLVPFFRYAPVPVRTCGSFHVSKHTLSQIPYLHRHDFYELIYVLRGSCGQRVEGKGQPLRLEARQACLLQPGAAHVMERCGENDIILKLSIPVPLYREAVSPILQPGPGADVTVFRNPDDRADWCVCMLMREWGERRAFCGTAVKNYLSLLFISLIRESEGRPALIARLCDYLAAHGGRVSLHEFAASIGYSGDYTGRMIRRCTGKDFTQTVLELKLARGARLLLETEKPVAAIAEELGYANPSGFYKQFCRAYRMTPGAYRERFCANR